MAKKKMKQKSAERKKEWKAAAITIVVIAAGVAGYFVYQKFAFDPYNFEKIKASKYVETFLADEKRSPAEVIADAALFVAVMERERSPILIGDDDQNILSKVSETYTQLELASKADWTSAYKAYAPQGAVRPESATLDGENSILNLGGKQETLQPKPALDPQADLEQLTIASAGNPDALIRVAQAWLARGDKEKAKNILDQVVTAMSEEKDIFVMKRVFSDVVLDYVKAADADKALEVYIKNNFFMGAGITLEMLREWVNQKDLDHAFYLFERMLYTPWQKSEALLILAEGYRQSDLSALKDDHARIINDVIKDTKQPVKEGKK